MKYVVYTRNGVIEKGYFEDGKIKQIKENSSSVEIYQNESQYQNSKNNKKILKG